MEESQQINAFEGHCGKVYMRTENTDLIGSVNGSDGQGVMLLRYLLWKINRRNKGREGGAEI